MESAWINFHNSKCIDEKIPLFSLRENTATITRKFQRIIDTGKMQNKWGKLPRHHDDTISIKVKGIERNE